jgi:hypothetical protein
MSCTHCDGRVFFVSIAHAFHNDSILCVEKCKLAKLLASCAMTPFLSLSLTFSRRHHILNYVCHKVQVVKFTTYTKCSLAIRTNSSRTDTFVPVASCHIKATSNDPCDPTTLECHPLYYPKLVNHKRYDTRDERNPVFDENEKVSERQAT